MNNNGIMCKVLKYIVSALWTMPILSSCTGEGKFLSIGKPHFISGFPQTGHPKEIEGFGLDEVRLGEVMVVDTLLFINQNSKWSIYSLDGKRKYGECMRVGNGPGEFAYNVPWISSCYFFHDNDSLFVYAPNEYKGQILELNITGHLKESSRVPHPVIETHYIQNSSWAVNPCGSNKVLITQPNDYFTGFHRLMYENDTVRQLPVTRGVDEITVNSEGNINLIAKVICYNAVAGRFAEAMLYLNQINIFSADGTEGKTICVGKRLDDISKVEKEPEISRRRDYISASAWDEGFGAIYSGASALAYQQHLSNNTQIQFFDWEGNPKYLVEFPYQVLSFDIDFTNNIMYVIHRADDRLIAYDATEIVKSLRS